MKATEHTLKLDLHVHSPASTDYLGNRSLRGYAELVKAFLDEDVHAIAITDHNTINGYQEYRRQFEAAKDAYRLMAARDDNSQVVKDLKCEVERYERLQVFPGVEITVYPNIHVILLFDESIVAHVNAFLKNDLELGDAVEAGDPKKCSKQSVVAMLDLAESRFKDKFFCILPHVETSKGAWEELQGSARIDLFKDLRVVAAQFSNPDTREHISKALANSAYRRKTPLGFIQCSDYHGDPNVKPASQFSMLKCPATLDFRALRTSLTTPDCVRCSHEFVEERLDEFLQGRAQVVFNFTNTLDIDPARRKELARGLCGILNSVEGVIQINLFNVTDPTGRNAEPISNLVRDLLTDLDPSDGFDFTISQFHQSNSRQRFCISIDENLKLRLLDGICWIVDDALPMPAPAWRVEQIVAQAHYLRAGMNKQRALEAASNHLIRVSTAFPAMPIAARLEPLLARKQCSLFDVRVVPPNYPPALQEDCDCMNGYPDGDFILIQPDKGLKGGRLNKQRDYYRFSAPLYRYGGRKAEDGETVGPNCSIVFPEGGVNCVSEQMRIFSPFPVFELKLPTGHGFAPKAELEMALGLTAWMKSSFLLWYLNAFYQTDDVFVILMQKRPVPLTADDDFIQSLSVYSRSIVTAEHGALATTAKDNPSRDDEERIAAVLTEHNKAVRDNMRQIDKQIFRHLSFTEAEVCEVYRVLRALDLYDYDISKTIDDFVSEVIA